MHRAGFNSKTGLQAEGKDGGELSMRVVRGRLQESRKEGMGARFDRLQKSLRPLRQGRRIQRGIHYGSGKGH